MSQENNKLTIAFNDKASQRLVKVAQKLGLKIHTIATNMSAPDGKKVAIEGIYCLLGSAYKSTLEDAKSGLKIQSEEMALFKNLGPRVNQKALQFCGFAKK